MVITSIELVFHCFLEVPDPLKALSFKGVPYVLVQRCVDPLFALSKEIKMLIREVKSFLAKLFLTVMKKLLHVLGQDVFIWCVLVEEIDHY